MEYLPQEMLVYLYVTMVMLCLEVLSANVKVMELGMQEVAHVSQVKYLNTYLCIIGQWWV